MTKLNKKTATDEFSKQATPKGKGSKKNLAKQVTKSPTKLTTKTNLLESLEIESATSFDSPVKDTKKKKKEPKVSKDSKTIDVEESDDESIASKEADAPSDEATLKNNDQAAIELKITLTLQERFKRSDPFNLKQLFRAKSHADSDVKSVVDHLARYNKFYTSYDVPAVPLHDPTAVYGYIWDATASDEREELAEEVQKRLFSLQTDERTSWKPILTEAKLLSSAPTVNDVMQRQKLISLCSKEISFGGNRLSRDTTPVEFAGFKDALDRAITQRHFWKRLLQFRPLKSRSSNPKKIRMLSIASDFKQLKKEQLAAHDFHSSKNMEDASLSLFEALHSSLTLKYQSELRLHKDFTKNQGPKLLWLILTHLSEEDEKIRSDFNIEIMTFKSIYKEENYNVHLLCPILYERLLEYQAAGGTASSHYGLISNALISNECDPLISKLRSWESREERRNSGEKCIIKLVQDFPSFVDALIKDGTWPYKKVIDTASFSKYLPEKRSIKKKTKETGASDITAFISQAKNLLKVVAASHKDLAAHWTANPSSFKSDSSAKAQKDSAVASSTSNKRNRTSEYRFCEDRWGESNKYFKTKSNFEDFYHGRSVDKKKVYNINGTRWSWCEECKRMGNHSTAEHKTTSSKKKKKPSNETKTSTFLPPTVGNVSVLKETEPFEIVETDTFEGVDDDSITQILGDLEEDSDNN